MLQGISNNGTHLPCDNWNESVTISKVMSASIKRVQQVHIDCVNSHVCADIVIILYDWVVVGHCTVSDRNMFNDFGI